MGMFFPPKVAIKSHYPSIIANHFYSSQHCLVMMMSITLSISMDSVTILVVGFVMIIFVMMIVVVMIISMTMMMIISMMITCH